MPRDLTESKCRPTSRPTSPCLLAFLTAIVLAATSAAPAIASEHTIGLGVHYWQTTDDLEAGLEDDGISFIVSYQYKPWRGGVFRFEIDLEYFDDGYGGSAESAYSPVLFAVFGTRLYVAAGVGVTFSSGFRNDPSDPFFASRLGYNLRVLPGLAIDLNLNYRTNAFDELGDFDTNAITVGAIARLKIK